MKKRYIEPKIKDVALDIEVLLTQSIEGNSGMTPGGGGHEEGHAPMYYDGNWDDDDFDD